ncbi:MAG: GNAT family N-acetyltransferase [Anaerolineae bacterium]|nr:GNAT family N-acetyltransferase [Anaerolineae bacterium]
MIDSSIRAKLDQHLVAAYAIRYRTILGGIFERMPAWLRGYSGLKFPTFNIFQPLFPTALNDDLLADTAAFFSSHEVLYTIELVHDRLPEGPDFLDQRRYQSLPPQPAMFLPNLPAKNNLFLNLDINTERVQTVPSLTAFCTLQHQVFDFPLPDMVKLFPVAHLEGQAKNIMRHYLAFLDEQPVGAGTTICLENVVSIWNVCTSDQYRGRGVATILVHSMLKDALESGCSTAMLYSTPQAYHLFNKLGFEIYTQRQWFLPPDLDYQDD